MRRSLVGLLAIALLTTAAAPAAEDGFRAVTINTPGQSGHVPVGDFARRTAGEDVPFGPHMVDQMALYEQLTYRDGGFQPDDGTPDTVVGAARVYRDGFGVPAIYAETLEDAWRAVGYAISEDRMWQQHLLRMVALGRSSELIGDDGLEMDIAQRRDFYTDEEYRAFYEALDPEGLERRVLDAYAEGVNLYLAEMHADPSKMPAEIALLSEPIEPWDPVDSLALGALMARSVASDGGQELENAQLLVDLVSRHGDADGQAIFDDLLWLNDPSAPTSVPAEEGAFPSYPHGEPAPDALSRSAEFVLDLPGSAESTAGALAQQEATRAELTEQLGLPNPGSNVWAVAPSRTADRRTMLFNGPQVGYSVAGLLTEFEIHVTEGEDAVDAKGVTVAGVPVVGIGYTDRHAWGVTSGLSDTIDLYVERLVGDDRHYEFEGETREMECRTEVFVVKYTAGLIEGQAPRVETREFCRTVHGPVIAVDADAGVAYSQRYAIWDREIGTLEGLMRFPYADSLAEFTDAMRLVTWNENTTYVDRDGHIAYWHPGLYPQRPRGWDERLPYPGTGEAEWEGDGFLAFEEMPHTIDPKQGYVANWNSKPSVGWTSGDPHYGDRPWGRANRLDTLTSVLDGLRRIPTFGDAGDDGLLVGTDGIFAPDVNGGLYDHTIGYFRPWLEQALEDPAASDRQRAALELMLDWDGAWDLDRDGRADHAGATIFDRWVATAPDDAFADYLTIGGFGRLSGHPWDPAPEQNLLLRAFEGPASPLPQSRDYLEGETPSAFILRTLDATLAQLAAQFEGAPLETWRGPARRIRLEVQGVGPGGNYAFQDRGSWIEVVDYPAPPPGRRGDRGGRPGSASKP